MSKIHSFRDQLAYSEKASAESFWGQVYKKAFPSMVGHMQCSDDTQGQRLGIDRLVHLSSGRTLMIDEKKRSKVYSDILLEYLSNDKTMAPGWIEKDLQIDYLSYAFMPIERVYLFPWHLLRRSWIHKGDYWKERYPVVCAKNAGYKTHSVAVPIEVLRKTVSTAAVIDLSS